jgi:hypothetical protein
MARKNDFDLTGTQRDAWLEEAELLIRAHERQNYLKNAYRVLLTRARQGMVVVVPRGDVEDPTRDPAYYDQTFDYLSHSGMSLI